MGLSRRAVMIRHGFHISDDIGAIERIRDAGKIHAGARHHLFGIVDPAIQTFVIPSATGVAQGGGIAEAAAKRREGRVWESV